MEVAKRGGTKSENEGARVPGEACVLKTTIYFVNLVPKLRVFSNLEKAKSFYESYKNFYTISRYCLLDKSIMLIAWFAKMYKGI